MPCVCLVSTCLTDLYVSVSFSFHFSLIWYELLKLLFETHINMLWFNGKSITTSNLFTHVTLWAQHTQFLKTFLVRDPQMIYTYILWYYCKIIIFQDIFKIIILELMFSLIWFTLEIFMQLGFCRNLFSWIIIKYQDILSRFNETCYIDDNVVRLCNLRKT